jgi:hypothetical protein
MIELTPTFQFGLEHRLNSTMSLQHEVGYITSYRQVDVENYWGARIRTEWRNYLKPIRYNAVNPYWAIEAFGQYNRSIDNRWYCREQCNYSERASRDRTRLMWGVAFEYGWMRLYEERFLMDIVTGIGLKNAQIVRDNLPSDLKEAQIDGNNLGITLLSDMTTAPLSVNYIFGIKIGYILK